jgi:hypothetical protein
MYETHKKPQLHSQEIYFSLYFIQQEREQRRTTSLREWSQSKRKRQAEGTSVK